VRRGKSATLAEAWNGSSWTVLPTPHIGGNASFIDVSCPTSSDCVAVGDVSAAARRNLIIELWNGTNWTIQKSPQFLHKAGPGFNSVSCATPSSCTALGEYLTKTGSQTLVVHWNGTSWVQQHVPSSVTSPLFRVSCSSGTSCTAVGVEAAVHWNGTTWTAQRPVAPPGAIGHTFQLYGVSCPTTSVCEAVGFYHAKSKTHRLRDRTLIEAN
jgi:hypothetical protein